MAGARQAAEGFYAAFNRNDLDAATMYFTDDVENIDPTGTIKGRDGFRAYIGGFKTAMPDAQLVIRQVVEEGDIAISEGSFTGTFTGPLQTPNGPVQPTGKSFSLPFAEVNVAPEGRIASHRVYYDQLTFLGMLGMMPGPG
jgi:predicted ester cyclase